MVYTRGYKSYIARYRRSALFPCLIMGDSVIESSLVFEDTDELWMSNALRGLCPLTVHDSPLHVGPSVQQRHLESKALVLSTGVVKVVDYALYIE